MEIVLKGWISYSARDADTHSRVYPSIGVKELPNVNSYTKNGNGYHITHNTNLIYLFLPPPLRTLCLLLSFKCKFASAITVFETFPPISS